MQYNKLVRDRIPEIIKESGKTPDYCTLDTIEQGCNVLPCLNRKLDEEVKEYHESIYLDSSIEELCDIIEVCYAICKRQGYSKENIDKLRDKKNKEKGAFDKLIFLKGVED